MIRGTMAAAASLLFSLLMARVDFIFADGGDTSLIHACVAKDGTMRIVSASTACKNNETALHWVTTTRIATDETRITNAENKNTSQDASIGAIQAKNTQQDQAIVTLQEQIGGTNGLVVVDTNNQVLGKFYHDPLFSERGIIRTINHQPVLMLLNLNTLQINGVTFYYTTDNCTGTRYIDSRMLNGARLTEFGQTTDGQTYYYPTLPAQQRTIRSTEVFFPGENPTGVGGCQPSEPTDAFLSTPSTFSVGVVVEPLHLE